MPFSLVRKMFKSSLLSCQSKPSGFKEIPAEVVTVPAEFASSRANRISFVLKSTKIAAHKRFHKIVLTLSTHTQRDF